VIVLFRCAWRLAALALVLPPRMASLGLRAQNPPASDSSTAVQKSADAAAAQKQRPDLGMSSLRGFVRHIGEEDDRIQDAIRAGQSQFQPRHDYATDIGISSDEEQTILNTLLPVYRKNKAIDDQRAAHSAERLNDLTKHYGPYEALRQDLKEDERASHQEGEAIAQAWEKLKGELSPDSLWNLERYLYMSKWQADTPPHEDVSQEQCPTAVDGIVTPPGWDHCMCRASYSDYFDSIGHAWETNVAEGRPYEQLNLPSGLAPVNDQERGAIPIVLDAHHKLQESRAAVEAGLAEYREKHPSWKIPQPSPPEVKALYNRQAEEGDKILDDAVQQLQEQLGDRFFSRFDAPLYRNCQHLIQVWNEAGKPR
jgi:hypothetical protein